MVQIVGGGRLGDTPHTLKCQCNREFFYKKSNLLKTETAKKHRYLDFSKI